MGNLFTSLINASGTLGVYGRALTVVQNNISNVNTPGYSRQDQVIMSLPFDPTGGLAGGIRSGPLLSARSEFLDQAVRNQQEVFGSAQQQTTDLGQVQPLFDPSSTFGVSSAFNRFFGAFSQLAVNPNDASARQGVVDQAGRVTESFHQAAIGINQVSISVDRQTGDAVAAVNRLATQIAHINSQYRGGVDAANDAGLSAQLNSALEELSAVADYSVIKTADGASNVYLGGQSPLVIGDHQFPLQADLSGPQTVLRDARGNDITTFVSRGTLGALITEKNTTLPGYLADLNQLAQTFSDSVNNQLSQGVDRNGSTPTANLFAYNSTTDAAFTLNVTGITPDQIAAASATAPGGNGNALEIAKLADTPRVAGFTFTQFFGNLGAKVGRDVGSANLNLDQSKGALAYIRSQRQTQTGVSLDQEAAKLLQYQQAYQATAKLFTVLNQLTDTLLNMIH